MSQIMENLNKSKNWVMKRSICDEIGEFREGVFTGSLLNKANVQTAVNDVMIAL